MFEIWNILCDQWTQVYKNASPTALSYCCSQCLSIRPRCAENESVFALMVDQHLCYKDLLLIRKTIKNDWFCNYWKILMVVLTFWINCVFCAFHCLQCIWEAIPVALWKKKCSQTNCSCPLPSSMVALCGCAERETSNAITALCPQLSSCQALGVSGGSPLLSEEIRFHWLYCGVTGVTLLQAVC